MPASAGMTRDDLAALAERAARLCKADLVTAMVGEFPELQGVIGGHLARAQGEPAEVADAIRDHYKPVGQGDEVPTAPVTVAVSLADKLDTLIRFFAIGERPTGSKDPFALRRVAISMTRLLVENGLRMRLDHALPQANALLTVQVAVRTGAVRSLKDLDITIRDEAIYDEVFDFLIDRLKVQQREAGVRHDLIDAVFALGGEDDLLARVRALQAFVETAEGADLLAGYKRAANILRKEGWGSVAPAKAGAHADSAPGTDAAWMPASAGMTGEGTAASSSTPDQNSLSYTPEDEEQKLIAALDSASPKARAAVEAEDFEGAMAALATLRAPVDAFFDKVTVNDPDAVKREARLALLARMRDAVHLVADFSRIEG
jgi:glycyl-tRNA synthetase beta chain